MNILDNIVKQMLEEHKGGEKFFDNLDASVRDKDILSKFYLDFVSKYWAIDTEIIVSGKFGVFFANMFPHISPVVVRGGLRKGTLEGELEYLRGRLSGIKCVFVDDSFYAGRTRNAIRNELERIGAKLTKTIVIYDGSHFKDYTVESMYRYYDHH